MNPSSSMLSDVVDNVNTPKDIAQLFVRSIKCIYECADK